MKIHVISSLPHYHRHIDAVWKHLPAEFQGEVVLGRRARLDNIPPEDVVMIGGAYDLGRTDARVIYVEHGAGQSYNGDPSDRAYQHSNYAGGKHPRNVIGYISPRDDVAKSWGRPAFAAGCPALDGVAARRQATYPHKVVFTFHFDARITAESRSAREHYLDGLTTMFAHVRNQISGDWIPYGHGHPRDPQAKHIWRNLGIVEIDLDEVLETASLLVADNTSVMYEAAALDIPVIALNAPWYRKTIHHGLRFWDFVPGQQIGDPYEFVDIALGRYADDRQWKQWRQEVTEHVYAVDPKKAMAGPAAAAWVCDLLGLA